MSWKDWFKSKPTWLKGGIIALLISSITIFIRMILFLSYSSIKNYSILVFISDTLNVIFGFPWMVGTLIIYPIFADCINQDMGCGIFYMVIVSTILSLVIWLLIGALIGWIVGKIRNR